MDIQELRREAQTMQPQLTADRRRLHRNPEAGAVLPETVAYVKGRLTEMGYHPQELGGGLTATVTGTDTGRCILLRADMDALRGQDGINGMLQHPYLICHRQGKGTSASAFTDHNRKYRHFQSRQFK